MIRLIVPYPPTLNKIWRHVRGHVMLSDEARGYKDAVHSIALSATGKHQLWKSAYHSSVFVTVSLHLYRPRKSGDIDNALKLILDAMQKAVYVNDSQIVELHVYRHDDKNNPRVEVEVSETPKAKTLL